MVDAKFIFFFRFFVQNEIWLANGFKKIILEFGNDISDFEKVILEFGNDISDFEKVILEFGNDISDFQNGPFFGPYFLPNGLSYKKVSHTIL